MSRILIVEDNVPLAWLLERILRGKYCITVRNKGLDALLWLSEGNVCDLIITDLHLRSLTGLDLLENLKRSRLYNKIPFIILTAQAESTKRCIELGAFCCIVKPFDPQNLQQQIKSALEIAEEKEEQSTNQLIAP